MKLAYQIARQQTYTLKKYEEIFISLAEGVSERKQQLMRKTASKIISLARYFREENNSTELENIPKILIMHLRDKSYLDKIGLYKSDAARESDCCKIGGGTRSKLAPVPCPRINQINKYSYDDHSYMTIEERIPFQHRRSYYRYYKSQNGSENLGSFCTFSPTAD